MEKSLKSEKDGASSFVSVSIYKIKATLTRASNCYYSISWKDKTFDSQNVVNNAASNQPTWLNLRHTITPTKVECWPSSADQLQQDQLQPGRTLTVKMFERGSGGLFGGDQLIGEANVAISKFIFNHSRDDSLGVTVTLTKKDASRGDVTIFAEATGVSAVIDALGSALAPAGSQVPQLFGWACDTLVNLSKQNKLKFQQYASAELLDSLASLTLAAFGASAATSSSSSGSSSDRKKDKDKGKKKDKSDSKKTVTVKLDEQQRAKLSALWKSMVEQELRKSLIANGMFGHLNKFLDPVIANEDLLLLGLDLCKPFFTVASHQRELVTQGVAARMVRLVESTSLGGTALPAPVPDRVRSKALDCLLYFDTPLHSDLVDLGLGSALVSLIAHKTIPAQLRLRCLELLTTLDGNQQKKMTQLEEKIEAQGGSGGLVANLLALLQDSTQPALQLKSLSYLSNTLATQDAVMDVLIKKGILTPLVRMLSQSSTPTTANHVNQLRSLAVDIIKKVQPRFAEKLCFETSFVRDLAILLLVQEQSAVDMLELFLANSGDSADKKKLRNAVLLSEGLNTSADVDSPAVPPRMPILKICIQRLINAGTGAVMSELLLTSMGLPAVFLDFFDRDTTRSSLVNFEKLRKWNITPQELEIADAWPVLLTPFKELKTTDTFFLPLLRWLAAQSWDTADNKKLAEKVAPHVLAYLGISVSLPTSPVATTEPEPQPQPQPQPSSTILEKEEAEAPSSHVLEEYIPLESSIQLPPSDVADTDEDEEEWPDDSDPEDLEPQLTPPPPPADSEPYYVGPGVPLPPDDPPVRLSIDIPEPPAPSTSSAVELPRSNVIVRPTGAPAAAPSLSGEALSSVWNLCIQLATALGKLADWGLLAKLLDNLIERYSLFSSADLKFLGSLLVAEPNSTSQPILYQSWKSFVSADFDAASAQLFSLWRTPAGDAPAMSLYASCLAEMPSEFSHERLQTTVFPNLIAIVAQNPITGDVSAIKLSKDWTQIFLSDPSLLKVLVNAAIIPLLPAGLRVSSALRLFRDLLIPLWTETHSQELLFGSGDVVSEVIQSLVSAASSGANSLPADSSLRSYLACFFEVLELEPVLEGLLDLKRSQDLKSLIDAFFVLQHKAVGSNVFSSILDKTLAWVKTLISKASHDKLRELAAVSPAPLKTVAPYCLFVVMEKKKEAAILDLAFDIVELIDDNITGPPAELYHSVASAFALIQEYEKQSLLTDMLKSEHHELIFRALHTLAVSPNAPQLLNTDHTLLNRDHIRAMLNLTESSDLSKLPADSISYFVSILQRFNLNNWMMEGTEVYAKSPPSLQSVLAATRRTLLRQKKQQQVESTPIDEVFVAESSSSSSSTSSSSAPSGGAGSSSSGSLVDNPQVASEGGHLNVLATWFSAGAVPYDKVGYVQLFDTKQDVPSNSNLLNSMKGKSNTLTLIKTRSGYIFGAFVTKPIPEGITSAPGTVRDVSAFLFTIKRPNGPPQPQKFSIRYSEASNAIQYNQGKFSLAFGRDDIGINLDSAVEKVKISESGQFSYLLPSNTASRSFFTGSTYVDFEQLVVFQMVDKTKYVAAPPPAPTLAPAHPSLSSSSKKKSGVEESTADKTDVKLMDRRLSRAINELLVDKVSKGTKWRLLAKHSVPGVSTEDASKLFTGEGITSVAPGPRVLIFRGDDFSVFGIVLSASNMSVGATGWIMDQGAAMFSVVHGYPSRQSVVAKKIILPAQASLLGHFYVARSTVLIGQGTDLCIDLNTGVMHSNPGISFRIPQDILFQTKEAHSLLTGRSGLSRVTEIEMWGQCPASLLPHYQRPTLPLLRSLINTLGSSALAQNKNWYSEISQSVQKILKKISSISARRALQVEEELLRVHALKPTATLPTSDDDESRASAIVPDPLPWKSTIIRTLLEMKYPGMSVLPFTVTSPETDEARSLTSPTANATAVANESASDASLQEYETIIKLTTTDLASFSSSFVTHIVLETTAPVEGLVYAHQSPEQLGTNLSTHADVDEHFGTTTEEWYKSNTDGEHLSFSAAARTEVDDAISEEAEMAATDSDELYSVLVLPGQHVERSASKRIASSQSYDLPSFLTSDQPVAKFTVTADEAATKPHVITLPCGIPAYQVVLCLKYRSTRESSSADLRQIVVVGYSPKNNSDIIPPPLPSRVQNVDEVFFLPRTTARPSKKIEVTCEHSAENTNAEGVLFLLGTSDTNEEVVDSSIDRSSREWKNPSSSGQISFKVSHGFYNKTTMNVELASSRPLEGSGVTCFWGGTAPTWFIIDMRKWRLAMTAFTLRHGYHYDNSFATDVVMHGANTDSDEPRETDWVELWRSKDPIFDKSFQVKTFQVNNPQATHFKFFRFLQHGNYTMGKSSAPGAPFMPISGVEIYGHLERDASADDEEEEDEVVLDDLFSI